MIRITIEINEPETLKDDIYKLIGSLNTSTTTFEVAGNGTADSGPKSWQDSPTAKADLVRLYNRVQPVGKKMLQLIAECWEMGVTFDEIKEMIPEEGDIQRRMNTVLQVARSLAYLDKSGKGVAPWNTEYMHGGKPMYTMQPELAQVIKAQLK